MNIALYTSEWAIYEAIAPLVQEFYFRQLLEEDVKSFRRIHRKVFRERQNIPLTIRRKLIPRIESLHDTFEIIDFDDLPPETHKNAQKVSLTSNFTVFDALHIAIAKYLSEYSVLDSTGNPVTAHCYIVTSDTSDFSQTKFNALGDFVNNLCPITPQKALELLENEV